VVPLGRNHHVARLVAEGLQAIGVGVHGTTFVPQNQKSALYKLSSAEGAWRNARHLPSFSPEIDF
jgi:hypothetical protein